MGPVIVLGFESHHSPGALFPIINLLASQSQNHPNFPQSTCKESAKLKSSRGLNVQPYLHHISNTPLETAQCTESPLISHYQYMPPSKPRSTTRRSMELLTRIAPHIFLTKLVLLADASAWDGAHQLYREKVTKLLPLWGHRVCPPGILPLMCSSALYLHRISLVINPPLRDNSDASICFLSTS
jgi:hypothetical protein